MESFTPAAFSDAESTALPTGSAEARPGVGWKHIVLRLRKSAQADEYLTKANTLQNMFMLQDTVGNLRVMAVWLQKTRAVVWFKSKEAFDAYKVPGTGYLDAQGRNYQRKIKEAINSLDAMLHVVNDMEPKAEKQERITA